jgi:GTPase SAR1 family protein
MDTEPRRQVPDVPFRVLIIGRANAGKTSILQKVCETTGSPIIYLNYWEGTMLVRGPTILSLSLITLPTRLTLSRQWKLVILVLLVGCL